MDAYIYDADIYCPTCAAGIKAGLNADGKKPANPGDEHTFDSGEYPKGPFADGGGEADTPQHCGNCHVLLDNPLTTAGIKYVVEALDAFVKGDRGGKTAGTASVLDQWVDMVSPDHATTDEQDAIIDEYRTLRATPYA